jgi:hypothetical protein
MRTVVGVGVLVLTIAGCRSNDARPKEAPRPVSPGSGSGSASGSGSGSQAAPPPKAPAGPSVYEKADAVRGTKAGIADAAATLAAGATADALWTATYVYAADGDDPKLLAPLLANADATIRVLAAGGLVRLGDPAAFRVLVAEAANRELFKGSEPPEAIGEIATLILSKATGEALAIDATPAAKAAWDGWYAQKGAKLAFDARKGWSVR